MQSAILQMIRGEKGTAESITHGAEYARLSSEILQADAHLRERLQGNKELLALYETVIDLHNQRLCLAVEEGYAEGFRFGGAVTADILKK